MQRQPPRRLELYGERTRIEIEQRTIQRVQRLDQEQPAGLAPKQARAKIERIGGGGGDPEDREAEDSIGDLVLPASPEQRHDEHALDGAQQIDDVDAARAAHTASTNTVQRPGGVRVRSHESGHESPVNSRPASWT